MALKDPKIQRRKPSQERGRLLIEAVLEATAQILIREGYGALSTNRIAQRAGVSVGSLYQYFNDKEEIVAALVDDFVARGEAHVGKGLVLVMHDPPDVALRRLIQSLIEFLDQQPELVRVLINETPRLSGVQKLHAVERRLTPLCKAYLFHHFPALQTRDLDAMAFLVVNAVSLLAARIVLEGPKKRRAAALDEELARMVLAYLGVEKPKKQVTKAKARPAARR